MKRINFLIKAGRHYANNFLRYRLIFSRSIEVEWKINHAAFYDYRNLLNGWSKIIGLSEGNHHKSSMRLSWMHSASGLLAGAYCYTEGKRHMFTLAKVYPGLWYRVKITRDRTAWIIELTEKYSGTSEIHTVPAPPRRWIPFLFVLHPYVGGQFTLPSDIKIEIWRQ